MIEDECTIDPIRLLLSKEFSSYLDSLPEDQETWTEEQKDNVHRSMIKDGLCPSCRTVYSKDVPVLYKKYPELSAHAFIFQLPITDLVVRYATCDGKIYEIGINEFFDRVTE